MVDQDAFVAAYDALAGATGNFTAVDRDTLATALVEYPASLIALRMVVGLTQNELAVAAKLVEPDATISGSAIKTFERSAPGGTTNARRRALVELVATTINAAMRRDILTVPDEAAANFHSKLDRDDTAEGWTSVHDAAAVGVPYSALLYQRYVGGAWRQVQDAYSEIKGDNVLEIPLERLLQDERVPYWRTPGGASGAAETARRFGLSPGPDFVIPDDQPAVIIESKVAEDGGTARDKASRIKNLADTGHRAGLVVCAVVDGKGWSERPGALVDVVIATSGRTYTLSTLAQLLDLPEINGLRGTAPGPVS